MFFRKFAGALISTALISLTGAQAGEFDGSRPLLCATMSAVECVDGSGCESRLPRDLDLPQFLRIDFKTKQIETVRTGGLRRTAKIGSVSDLQSALLLQGVQDNLGWTISIEKPRGNMSATVADRDFVFVVFGACMSVNEKK